jgi:hypothetical protein
MKSIGVTWSLVMVVVLGLLCSCSMTPPETREECFDEVYYRNWTGPAACSLMVNDFLDWLTLFEGIQPENIRLAKAIHVDSTSGLFVGGPYLIGVGQAKYHCWVEVLEKGPDGYRWYVYDPAMRIWQAKHHTPWYIPYERLLGDRRLFVEYEYEG